MDLFSPLLQVNSGADKVLLLWYGNQSRRKKNSEFKLAVLCFKKIDFIPHPVNGEGVGSIRTSKYSPIFFLRMPQSID